MIIGIVAAAFVAATGVLLFEVLHTPAGVERETQTRQNKIYSRTRAITHAKPAEVIRLLQTDWSWWKKARAEQMKDLGDGRKEFVFHPSRFFNILELPTTILMRLEPVDTLADGGKRIRATVTGDFDGTAEYTARPGADGTVIELAWCGVEVRGSLSLMPIQMVAAVHCWRERLGIEGLRDRLESIRRDTGRDPRLDN
jgi:hypothetical protein